MKNNRDQSEMTDQLLKFRKTSIGKYVVYIVFPTNQKDDSVSSVCIAWPKIKFDKEATDFFIRSMLENYSFSGVININQSHEIWDKILHNRSSHPTYYRFRSKSGDSEQVIVEACIVKSLDEANTNFVTEQL